MPELPEVETIVRRLRPRLTGRRISNLEILWPRTLCNHGPAPERIRNQRVDSVERRGKFICLGLQDLRLTIHLRMSGRVVFDCRGENPNHIRARIHFENSECLTLVDARKFARIQLWPREQPFLPRMGPEPLRRETVKEVLDDVVSHRPIKAVLLDQHILAGIGNIYADESLFLARIHPQTPARNLTPRQRSRLAAAIPRILEAAIQGLGTTLNDYRDPNHQPGVFQHQLCAYQRTGKPCLVCGTPIARIVVAQRGTHFCPRCQRERAK